MIFKPDEDSFFIDNNWTKDGCQKLVTQILDGFDDGCEEGCDDG